jgi:hypothetical protein
MALSFLYCHYAINGQSNEPGKPPKLFEFIGSEIGGLLE